LALRRPGLHGLGWAPRACRRVVARFGPVTEFSWKGETLSAEQLAACNA
jgi:hypothetical protein